MRHYKPEYTFAKYKPYQSPWKKFFSIFKRKKQKNIYPVRDIPSYKVNPFKKKSKKSGMAGKIIGILLFILIIAWIGLLIYMPYFRINNIECSGLININQNELTDFIKTNYLNGDKILPVNDYFLVDTNKIQKALIDKFSVQSIAVEKIFPNQLKVEVVEKKSALIYDNGQKYFLLDDGGSMIKYLTDVDQNEFKIVSSSLLFSTDTPEMLALTTTSLAITNSSSMPIALSPTTTEHIPDFHKIETQFGSYPILYDRRGLTIEEKQMDILPDDLINFIVSWYGDLPKQGIEPQYFVLDNLNSGILIKTNKSWNIFVQPGNDYNSQLNNLKTILKSIKPKEYIDLRFGERVYWK